MLNCLQVNGKRPKKEVIAKILFEKQEKCLNNHPKLFLYFKLQEYFIIHEKKTYNSHTFNFNHLYICFRK